jgi:hypothetical protein
MTKVIWLGEDSTDVAGPSFTTCYGLKFPKGEAVELTDPDAIRRAKGNLNFKVEETKQENSHGESQTQDEDKIEDKGEAKEKDYREREKGTGYSPVKKKVRKKKPPAQDADTPAT